MISKKSAIEMYNSDKGFKKYSSAVTEIGLWKSEKKVIESYIDKKAKILDLGCGCGRTTFGLYDIGYCDIEGLDLSERQIMFAKQFAEKKKKNIKFSVGDATQLPYNDETFDFVFYSFNGIQLIPGYENRLSCFKEVYRVLKKGGYFIFTAHNREVKEFKEFWDNEKIKWDNDRQDTNLEIFGDMIIFEDDGQGFIHYSSIDEIKNILEYTGFKICEKLVKMSCFLTSNN